MAHRTSQNSTLLKNPGYATDLLEPGKCQTIANCNDKYICRHEERRIGAEFKNLTWTVEMKDPVLLCLSMPFHSFHEELASIYVNAV